MKTFVLILTLLLAPLPAFSQKVVFNDSYSDTTALEIWRLTDDSELKHHSIYHNMTPFSYDGRYCFYVIVERGSPGVKVKHGRTFGIFDLHEDREICRDLSRAYTPIWGNTTNAIYFVDDPRQEDATLYRLEIPSLNLVPLHTGPKSYCPAISADDKFLFTAENGQIYRYENREHGEKMLIYTPEHWPDVQISLPKASPVQPWLMCRQNSNHAGVPFGTPARVIIDVDGRFVNVALMQSEHSHADWHASGKAILRGDGSLRIRRVSDTMPSDFLPLASVRGGDPARQGASARWGSINAFANGVLYLSDLRSGRSWPVVRTVSHVHQPATDTRDLSGPYDCDQHGSPDGTKMYFSTNYDIRNFPVAVTDEPVLSRDTEAISVISTEGFADSGLLSFGEEIVRYESKTLTQFQRLTRGCLGTNIRNRNTGTPIADFYGRADKSAPDSLEHQNHTDAYIAVVRLPDSPTIAKSGKNTWLLSPGRNHQETRALALYKDGEKDREWLVNAEVWEVVLQEGQWKATAIEWSGLESNPSQIEIKGPAKLTIDWKSTGAVDRSRSFRRTDRSAKIEWPSGVDSVTVKSDEEGDYLWEFAKAGEITQRHWATPGYPVTLIDEFRKGVRARRRILDNAGVREALVATYDNRSGRLTTLRRNSLSEPYWEIVNYSNGLPETRVRSAPGRYETHYRYDAKALSFRQTATYKWRGGKKIKDSPE